MFLDEASGILDRAMPEIDHRWAMALMITVMKMTQFSSFSSRHLLATFTNSTYGTGTNMQDI